MSCLDQSEALRVARHHLSTATSPALQEYWTRVIASIESKPQ
jgi:hypothetical protein